MNRTARLAATILALTLQTTGARADDWSATVYGAKITSQPGWEDIFIDTAGTAFVESYLLTAAVARRYATRFDGGLDVEAEGQVVRHFGDQTHWEFNAVPVVLRWKRFPWSDRVATTAAFGLGLSYATELPPVEVRLEGESAEWLVYWVMEVTAGPVDSNWAVSLRLHHRSVGYGLMGEEGGMNALGLGVRLRF
jgi:hypothetical protein